MGSIKIKVLEVSDIRAARFKIENIWSFLSKII